MLTRRQGRAVGVLCGASAALAFARCAFVKFHGGAAAVGTVLGALSYRLFTQLYLHDPEALAEYRAGTADITLAHAVSKYGVRGLRKIVGPQHLRDRLMNEVGLESLAHAIRELTLRHLLEFASAGACARAELERAAAADVAGVRCFSALWLTRFHGELPAAWAHGFFDANAVRNLVYTEYAWVAPDGSPQASPRSGSAINAPLSPIRGAQVFGAWTVKHLAVSPGFWRAVIRTCEAGSTLPLSHLVAHHGLVKLHADGLVDVPWAQKKFDAELQLEKWSLWAADDRLKLRGLIECGLIRADQICEIFAAAIPGSRGSVAVAQAVGSGLTKESNIIAFLRYWEATLRRHPELIPPRHARGVRAAVDRFRDAEAEHERECQAARSRSREREAHHDATKPKPAPKGKPASGSGNRQSATAQAAFQEELGRWTAARREIEHELDAALANARRRLESEQRAAHDSFAAWVRRSDGNPFLASVEASCRIQ